MQAYIDAQPQVTFNKKIYRRHTKLNSWKKTYCVDDQTNILEIDYGNPLKEPDTYTILKNLWVKSDPSIQKISVVLVPEYEVPYTFEIVKHKDLRPGFFRLELERRPEEEIPNNQEVLDWDRLNNIDVYDPNDLNNKENMKIEEDDIFEPINPDEIKEFKANNPRTNISKLDLNQNISLTSLLEIKNTLLVSSLSIETIKLINSYKRSSNAYISNYIQIPINDVAFVSQFIFKSKYRLYLHFEKLSPTPLTITAKYSTLQDQTEINRFEISPHEYLIKRGIETKVVLKSNLLEQQIVPHYTQIPLCTMIISSPIELESVKITAADNIEYDLICSRTNPENPYSSEKRWFYLLDQFVESCGFDLETYQPIGYYNLISSNPIKIKLKPHDSTTDIELDIMYLSYDIVRYMGKNFISLLSYLDVYKNKIAQIANAHLDDLNKLDKLLTFEEFATHYYSWLKQIDLTATHFEYKLVENQDVITYSDYKTRYLQLHPEQAPVPVAPNVLNQNEWNDQNNQNNQNVIPNYPIRTNTNLNISRYLVLYEKIYVPILFNVIKMVEKCTSKCKKLDQNTICEITLDEIKSNDYYYNCEFCSGTFSLSAYKTWIEDTTKSGACPKCQKKILIAPQLYINKDKYLTYNFWKGVAMIGLGGIIGLGLIKFEI